MRAFMIFGVIRGSETRETLKIELTPDQVDKLELLYKHNDPRDTIEGPGLLMDYDACEKELTWKPMRQSTQQHSDA